MSRLWKELRSVYTARKHGRISLRQALWLKRRILTQAKLEQGRKER